MNETLETLQINQTPDQVPDHLQVVALPLNWGEADNFEWAIATYDATLDQYGYGRFAIHGSEKSYSGHVYWVALPSRDDLLDFYEKQAKVDSERRNRLEPRA